MVEHLNDMQASVDGSPVGEDIFCCKTRRKREDLLFSYYVVIIT